MQSGGEPQRPGTGMTTKPPRAKPEKEATQSLRDPKKPTAAIKFLNHSLDTSSTTTTSFVAQALEKASS